MDGTWKLLLGVQAVLFTAGGVFFLYAATLGVDDWSWLSVGEYVWFGILWLMGGLLAWYILFRRTNSTEEVEA
jgi:hypothetical protein